MGRVVRIPIVVLGILLIFSSGISVASPESPDIRTGLLGELVGRPMLSASFELHYFSLTEEPREELTGLPPTVKGRNYSFGEIKLGSGPDRIITAVFLHNEDPRLWLDRNNNEDLSDDGDGNWDYQPGRQKFEWTEPLQVEYRVEGRVISSSYQIKVYGEYDPVDKRVEQFNYGVDCQRRGLLDLEDGLYPIALTDLNSDGRYDDLENLVLSVDTDRDGKLDTKFASHEVYHPQEPFRFQVGTTEYRMESVSPDGSKIKVAKVGREPPRPILEPGEPAPGFESETLTGESISLSDYRGKIVLLIFWSPTYDYLESTCRQDGGNVLERIRFLDEDFGDGDEDVALIGIATGDEQPKKEEIKPEEVDFPIVWDPEIVDLYRWLQGFRAADRLFVIGKDGTIKAMDQLWVKYVNNRPVVEYDRLDPLTVSRIVDALTN